MDDHVHAVQEKPKEAPRGLIRGFIRGFMASKTTHKALIGTTLGLIAAVLLYIPAVVGYFYFYYRYLPHQVTTVPVHLQYGCVCLWTLLPSS